MLRTIALSLSCAALALGASACGEEAGSGGDGDPASLVPASAAMYVEATVRPEGGQRDDALAAAGKLMRTDDPAGEIRRLVDEALKEDDLSWERDFAPWMGERGAIWGDAAALEGGEVAGVFAVSDEDAAREALPRLQEGKGESRTHEGVDYLLDEDGNAAAVVDGFLVVGDEPQFKKTLDAREGDTLGESDRYDQLVGELEDDRLGLLYVDTRAILEASAAADPASAQSLEQVKAFFPYDKLGPFAMSLQADGDRLAIDQVLTDVPEGPLRNLMGLFGGESSELLGQLPGDAFAAYAVPNVGEGARELFKLFAGAIGGAAIGAQVEQQLGLDLEQDVFAWMGDLGFFVRGTSTADVDGALVIESTDEARSDAAFGKLVGLIGRETGAPPKPVTVPGAEQAVSGPVPATGGQSVVLARGAGRVVAAYGEAAAAAALSTDEPLSDAPAYGAAEEALGDYAPAFVLSMPPVLGLIDEVSAGDAEWQEVRPYLESLETVATGGSMEEGDYRSRTVVTLK